MIRRKSVPPELPGYTFVRVLGSGGFSDVFLYDQKLPKRRVAVKVLLTEELVGTNRAAFVAEANLMAQLSTHPYIVTIYQADVASDDRPYFVMEYCSGPSLAERYKQETFLVADALRIGVRLSSAVATAHAAGILHRDIKPANVLTNDYGWPALTDFGISSAVEDDALAVHTTTLADALRSDPESTTEGTAASVGMSVPWSPPEMFADDPEPDVRSDVFSLAATIHTILAGQTPFEVRGHSNGTLDLIGRIERGAITPLTRDDVPRSLVAVLRKGMASDRNDRFSTAVEFARALQRVELELGYAPTTIDVPNLLIEAPSREDRADDADETRARSVTSIQAQPVTAAPARAVPPIAPPPTTDETRVRGAKSVDAQPLRTSAAPSTPASGELSGETIVRPRVATPAAGTDTEPAGEAIPARTARGTRVLMLVSAAVVMLIAAVIVVGIVTKGPPTIAKPTTPAAVGGGDTALVDSTPMPTVASAPVLAGTTVTFTFANPNAKPDDSYQWRVSSRGGDEASHPSMTGVIVLPGYVSGSTLCVQATVVRSGKTSEPTESCYPS